MAMTLKAVLALIIVLLLMYITLKLFQKYTKYGMNGGGKASNFKIEAVTYIDENTKIVNIKYANNGYILAVSKQNLVLLDKYEVIN